MTCVILANYYFVALNNDHNIKLISPPRISGGIHNFKTILLTFDDSITTCQALIAHS